MSGGGQLYSEVEAARQSVGKLVYAKIGLREMRVSLKLYVRLPIDDCATTDAVQPDDGTGGN